ncbi:hypothetical protein BVG88_07425 [Serratia marcescens]|uniref:hypothetical protein n=1 Tax=Serratia TaxID=613 RepID=UPI000B5E0D0A|nr:MULTISPECIES: hypothetical protein [Serratia]ASM01999.1 hypothetical protein BVG88_07425 [Serratia marcescens]MBH2553793.1 hypothetical protein [Serratia ureilytica]MBH3266281.1 hypothetical protein [Serratia ureilytica]
MTWETIYNGNIDGDLITVKKYVDDEFPAVRATLKTYEDNEPLVSRAPEGIIIGIPHDKEKRYTLDYDNINDMYKNIAEDSGRDNTFPEKLKAEITRYKTQ